MTHRSDTANQRDAKRRVAEKLRCPSCSRRAALGTRLYLYEPRGPARLERLVGSVRVCRYCGHETGRRDGEAFGR